MDDLLRSAADRASRYLAQLADRAVAPSAASVERLAGLGGPLPDRPTDPAEVLELLDRLGAPATVATAGPRYFGLVIGGVLPASLAASSLANAWDQNAGLVVASPLAAAIEEIALGWMRDLLALPASADGALVTCATTANLCGIAAGRHRVLADAGWDVEAQGLFGAPPITVVVGDEVHASVLKALAILGLGRERVVRVPTDAHGRIRADLLPAIDGPTIVCIQAGNVNTGAFDPAAAICAAAHRAGAWVHVDAAFGLWARACPSRARLAHGFEDADSWALDAHKWLNVPYDSGVAFVRSPGDLRAAMSASAAYLLESGSREPSHYTPEMSRRARSIEIWAALRSLGRSGLADLVERTCQLAKRFADGLRAAGHEVLNDVVLNQVLVAFGDDETTRRVIERLQEDGTCWCGSTVWHGRTAMRISVSSWATAEADVDESLGAMLRIAAETCGPDADQR